MAEPKTIHRLTLLGLVFIGLVGGLVIPFTGVAAYLLAVIGGFWIMAAGILGLFLMASLVVLMIAGTFRPR